MSLCSGFKTIETVYILRDNPVSIVPYSDFGRRVNWDMSETTNVLVTIDALDSTTAGDAISVSSQDNPSVVQFGQNPDGEWVIHMLIGMAPSITVGEKQVRVVLFDPFNINGVVVASDLFITVVGLQ